MNEKHAADDALIVLKGRSGDAEIPFSYEPDEPTRKEIQSRLNLLGLRKTRLKGKLIPEGRKDWRLNATLGATVVQACVVTLDPVTTRIDTPILRHYAADFEVSEEPGEIEMPEDDSVEALPDAIDLAELLSEALAIELPDFPRAAGVTLENKVFTEEGTQPLQDEGVKPFAALKALRERSSDDSDK